MEDKVKLIINKLIYEMLELENIEKEFVNLGVKNKEIINNENYDIVSKYFFLKNDVYLERLSLDELKFLEEQINSINFSNIIVPGDLSKFLLERIKKLLLPETNEKYLSWHGTSDNFLAPSDAIVLGFHYIKYLEVDESIIDMQEEIIYNKMNFIQEELAPSKNMKVAVLIFNELIPKKEKIF